jgi:2-dehydropantoate 2-reductase
MKIGVMGAGAVGCYYGAMLARAGHEVTLVGRESFVRAVCTGGLVLESHGSSAPIRVEATTDPAALSFTDLILFCVKSADTTPAGRQLAPRLRAECPVLSLQNGVDNPERLAAVLGRPVVPVAVYVAVEMAGPAHVKHLGRGDLIMGRFAGSDEVAQAFAAAGIPARVSDDVVTALWQKLITNCAYNALSAIARMSYGQLVQVPGMTQVMTDVAAEAVAVGRGLGVALPALDMQPILELAVSMAGQYSSTAQDLARHKPTEIDYLNGYVVHQGSLLGIPTPANRVLVALVRALKSINL